MPRRSSAARYASRVASFPYPTGEARVVQRELVHDLGERRPGAAHRPVDEHGAPVGMRPEVGDLGVAVQERGRGVGQGVEQRPRRVAQRAERGRELWGDRPEPAPSLVGQPGDRLREAERALAFERGGPEERVAVRHRDEADRVLPAPSGGVERSQVIEDAQMLLEGEGHVVGRDEGRAHVAHEDRAAFPLTRRADGRVVDAVRHEVEHARLPHQHRHAADVTGLAHDPVVAVVDVLQHERVAVDHHPLEAGARLRVDRHHRGAARRTGDQLVDRRRDRAARHYAPPPPVPAQNWPRSTMTCWGA